MTVMAKTTSWKFAKALVEAGVITEERLNNTHRIVIDLQSDGGLFIYTQEYGDGEALAKLAPMLKGMIPDA
jgi:hypothetical protein